MEAIFQSSTDVRNNFSSTMDKAIYERPQFIKRTRDHAVLLSTDILSFVLSGMLLHYSVAKEKDGSFVLSCTEIDDIIASGKTEDDAKEDMADQLQEYTDEYYEEFALYSRAPNRKDHLPYVLKILSLRSKDKIKEMLYAEVV